MRSPTLKKLPPPPPDKTCTEPGRSAGWPWTEESEQLPETMADGSPWLRISIVTPSYNQGQFIEETIRSVLLQGYPNLEFIIIDGGSTDNSVDIIKKYEPWLAHWVSEPDWGMYDALNKGLKLATGDLIAFCNADDFYEQGVFFEVAHFSRQLESSPIIVGDCREFVEKDGSRQTTRVFPAPESNYLTLQSYPQINACFFPLYFIKRINAFDPTYRIIGDIDFLMKLAQIKPRMKSIGLVTYHIRIHEEALTNTPLGKVHYNWSLEHYRLAQKWLNDENLTMETKQFSNRILAKACFRLAKMAALDHRWDEADQWFWKGIRGAPWPMLIRLIKYANAKIKHRVKLKSLRTNYR